MAEHTRARRSLWTALTVPTFKMRIGQTFVVVLCLVGSLVAVGGLVLWRSANTRGHAENAARLYGASAELDAAALAFQQGDGGAGDTHIAEAEQRLDGSPPEYARLEGEIAVAGADRDTARLSELEKELEVAADAEMKTSVHQQLRITRTGVVAYVIILIITAIMGIVTMTVAYRGLSGVTRRVIDEVNQIARGKGDLTARVHVPTPDVNGELADAINDMVSSLRQSMLEIRSIAGELTGSADALAGTIEGMTSSIEEVTSAAEQISTGTEDQAHKVEDTSVAMAQVSGSIESIAEGGRVSATQSELSAEMAERGVAASEEAVTVMLRIYDSVKHSERLMGGLGERFTQIGIIIDVITDIADQTNLLALNAAIEAARAGEHGKGFAVVAGEVRKLAENSKRSAEQISHLIREINSETAGVLESMEEGTERVESGRTVAEDTGEALRGMMESSRTAARAASEISRAIQEIAVNTDRVFDSINDIAAIAQETAASTEEVAATINEQRVSTEDVAGESMSLARLAAKLQELTQGFKL
ncbi:MAG: methyl-accepting chemotaxis protein [Actinomycetota bacterium]